jgi:methionyl-tRNA formyltransferase
MLFGAPLEDYPAAANQQKVHRGVVVNSGPGIDLIKGLRPDVLVCFGGPVYSNAFIDSCPMVLNYHSGLSPLYNGTSSIRFAFANGHPHLCGGTLMKMNSVVDGGDVLGHFLPDITESDTPSTLFAKTARGAAVMYSRLLGHLERGKISSGVPQSRPLFYYRSSDWTLFHAQMVRSHLRAKVAARFRRTEQIFEYWREPDLKIAQRDYESTITGLLLAKP